MKIDQALASFSALSQETRLRVFKLLIEYGDDGAAAGILSKALGIAHNTLSFHLSHLCDVGLIQSRKQGRSMVYSANYAMTQDLIRYMVENCCAVDFVCMHENNETGKTTIELFESCCPSKEAS